jgi:hypothetical protein
MNDDKFLQEIAQVSRELEAEERRRLDERWDRLSSGDLSAEEEAELRALAATSDEAREAYEAFRPLGADFQARVVQAIRKQAKVAPAPWAKLLSFLPHLQFAGWSAAATAAAATLVFLLRSWAFLNIPSLEVLAAVQMRGELEPGEVKVFAPGDQIKVILRPQTAPPPHIWPMDVGKESINKNGVATMQCALKDNQRPGRWTLLAVIGRRGMLPDSADLRFASTKGPIRARDWVALPEKILIQPRGVAP